MIRCYILLLNSCSHICINVNVDIFLWLGSFLLSIVINYNFKNLKKIASLCITLPLVSLMQARWSFKTLSISNSFLFHSFCICCPLVLKYPQLLLFLILQISASVSLPQRNHSWPQFSPAILLLLLLFFFASFTEPIKT